MKKLLVFLLFACIMLASGVGSKAADVITEKLCIVEDVGSGVVVAQEVAVDTLDKICPVQYIRIPEDFLIIDHSSLPAEVYTSDHPDNGERQTRLRQKDIAQDSENNFNFSKYRSEFNGRIAGSYNAPPDHYLYYSITDYLKYNIT